MALDLDGQYLAWDIFPEPHAIDNGLLQVYMSAQVTTMATPTISKHPTYLALLRLHQTLRHISVWDSE